MIWEDTDAGIVIEKVITGSGRGIWSDDDIANDEREEIARALEGEIRERRDTEWAVE